MRMIWRAGTGAVALVLCVAALLAVAAAQPLERDRASLLALPLVGIGYVANAPNMLLGRRHARQGRQTGRRRQSPYSRTPPHAHLSSNHRIMRFPRGYAPNLLEFTGCGRAGQPAPCMNLAPTGARNHLLRGGYEGAGRAPCGPRHST
jgi:hypothetical protein